MAANLWDFSASGEKDDNVMREWAKDEKLGTRERAQLNAKLDLLSRVSFEQAVHCSFLAGTSGDHNHIFKLVVKSQRMLRPMLCRGSLDIQGEYTLLCGAVEKDMVLDPRDAAKRAEDRRLTVIDAARKGRNARVQHERF